MQSRLCIVSYEYQLHWKAGVCEGGGCYTPSPSHHPFSQLITVVIQQRRLCIGLLVPPWYKHILSTENHTYMHVLERKEIFFKCINNLKIY